MKFMEKECKSTGMLMSPPFRNAFLTVLLEYNHSVESPVHKLKSSRWLVKSHYINLETVHRSWLPWLWLP